MRIKTLVLLFLCAILLSSCTSGDTDPTPDSPTPGPLQATIETEKGTFTLELFSEDAPQTVGNFATLADQGFYDGLTFHRVIPGFMAQGGCPNGDGTGGPGYTIPCEINSHKHVRGAVSMAHAGRDTGGSQFFICFEAQPHLDGEHTVFGQVVSGMETVDQIEPGDRMVSVSVHPVD